MTKIHAATGGTGKLIKFVLTGGQCGDAPQGERLVASFEREQIGTMVADEAYDSDAIRKPGKQLKSKVCIKPDLTRNVKKRYDRNVYKN